MVFFNKVGLLNTFRSICFFFANIIDFLNGIIYIINIFNLPCDLSSAVEQ